MGPFSVIMGVVVSGMYVSDVGGGGDMEEMATVCMCLWDGA